MGRRRCGAGPRGDSGVLLVLLVLPVLLQLRGRGHALAEGRAALAGDVLAAHRLARRLGARALGRVGHRDDALAEGRALLAGDVLLGLVLAVLAVGLGLGRRSTAGG